MALVVLIKNAVNLRGRYDRIARISFRGITYQTQVYEDCSDPDWDEEFEWPLASQLNPSEYIEIQVLNHNKIFSNRVVGLYRMVLQRLIQEQHLALTDSLLDNNNTVLKAQISLELTYNPPSGTVSEWVNGLQEEPDDSYAENGEEIFTPGARRPSKMSLPSWKKGVENGQVKVGSSMSLNSLGHNAKHRKSFGNLTMQMTPDMNRSGELGPSQLGVVAGPFGQMLQAKDTGQMSRRGSLFSVASAGSGTGMFHQHPKVRIDQKEIIKEIDYQIQIRVIEARQLSGMQLDPVTTVTVGNQKKHTAVKEQTNTPFWDEFFVFDFKMPALILFDKIINFQVFTGRNLISQGLLIGAFKLDIGTVYAQSDHRFIRRWAVLTDPDETLGASGAGVKGYLKVDITVLGKGDPIKEPPSVKDNDDDIESNLLLPDGVPAERPKARIVVKIYKAEGLPKMNSGLMANVKKAFTGEVRDLADPYVEVCFAGHKARTTVKKHTYEPDWNEQITFAELFPPLCRRIKVQLKDSDSVTDEVVGTHFIDLSQISNDGANGFMPTFGPCWVNLYGSTRDFSLFDEHNSLNEGLGEGVAYRGRLLMAVQAEMGESASDASIKQVEVDGTAPISDTAAGKEDNIQLFACIYEASMIERKAGEKNVSFEMTIGNYGNTIDGQFVRDDLKEDGEGEDERFIQSISPQFKATSADRQYYYIPFEDTKPCLHIKFPYQDHRRRLYLSNMLYKIYERLEDGLDDVHERVKMDLGDTYKCLKIVLKDLVKGCGNFINICENKISGPTVGRTKLDRERQKLCINEVRSIAEQSKEVLESIHDNVHVKENLRSAMEFLKRIQTIVQEPQHSIPDIFIWMLSGNKRVAYTRVPAQHVAYSPVDWEKGRNAGKVQSIFLRLPGKRGDGPKGWAIQAKLDILIWLGLHKHKKDYLKDAPKGFQMPKGANKMMSPPPNQLVYTEKQKFMLRAHIYQARSLIGSDASGLSDAFGRVIFGQMAADTRVIWETRSPTWDQTIIFKECVIWGDVHESANNPPTIVIEIFDKDIGGDSEFIGRALARPVVKLASEKYDKPNFPPALEWFEIQRGDEKAGELLAAFELLHVVDEGKCFLPKEEEPVNTQDGPIIPVPDGIRPVMKKHRIEVLFWGVREMKRVNLTTVDRPQVDIDCAGQVVTSTVIANAKKNPNFSTPITFFDVELPENERYCPPLTVRVRDCRTFGRFTLVGTHVVNSLHRYLQDPQLQQEETKTRAPEFGGKKGRKSVDASKKAKPNDEGTSRPQSPTVEQTIVEIGDPGEDEDEDKGDEVKKKGPGEKGKDEEDDDEDSLDWWSRYYETVKDAEREDEEQAQKDAHKDVAVNTKNKKGAEPEPPKRVKRPNPKITRIKIYKQELENLAEFNGFNDWLFSFPLFRGKKTSEEEDDDHRIVGKFKGALKVWKFPLPKIFENEPPNGSFAKLPSNEPVNVLVRVYVVRASELHPTDVNGKADPYLVVTCGKQKNKDRDNYIPKQLNPIFGRVFDFEGIIPMDNMVTIGVYDYDLVGSDDLIGETKIDIENRFYSKHRPMCGLSEAYATFGFNKWRDPMKPNQILARLCKDEGLDGPTYTAPGKCKIENHIFSAPAAISDEAGNSKPSDEPAALIALHNFHTIGKRGYHLTPEHVETRSLYNPEKPGIEQGKVEIWIDMFAMDMPSPGAPVDITPRKPAAYELRVVIWNTEDVLMDEVNLVTGEACSDIYVKGWIEGMKDEKQQTDVHYRSLTGEGNFNWRFIFPFQYQKAEEKIVIKKKATFFSWDESEEKVPPRLTLQVWDADAFSADDFIGDCCLDMVRMPRGAKSAKTCKLDTMKTDKPTSLFKLKHIKAWWPFTVNTDLEEPELAGKVEAELELLSQEEAEKAPAGLAREEPQPLEKPNRPDTSFTWFMNPFKSLRYMIWEQYKFCLLKFLVIGLLIALMGLFFYSMPGYTVKKIFNA